MSRASSLSPGQRDRTRNSPGGIDSSRAPGAALPAPALSRSITKTYENGEKWVSSFISDPEKMYGDPYVKGMIDFFNLKMPNQHMNEKETQDIIEYLKWIDNNANLF